MSRGRQRGVRLTVTVTDRIFTATDFLSLSTTTFQQRILKMETNPAFPLELERYIFETTALLHPGAIPTLLRVARRIFIVWWIEPFLYRVFRINNEHPYSDMTRALLHASHASCTMWFDTLSGIVQRVVEGPVLKSCLGQMQLHRFAGRFGPGALFGSGRAIDMRHPLFFSITDLEIFDTIAHDDTICPQIPTIPALTQSR
ncbi:hypothetical protein C8R44DRAFT_877035 [Mycena epipterygia]|nr:hypothetical protein C8R44DRAFT_877035 [Mycena epipterygia]